MKRTRTEATKRAALFALFAFAASTANGQRHTTSDGHVEFLSRVPLHSFTGTSDRLQGLIELDTRLVDFYLDLTTLETGNGKRDRDMRAALETDDFPFAEFTGRLEGPFNVADTSAQAVTAAGTFSIHGVSRPMTVEGTLRPAGDAIELIASWTVSLADFEIRPPRLLIVKVADTQEVTIRATLRRTTE